jgi:hypothetical protein
MSRRAAFLAVTLLPVLAACEQDMIVNPAPVPSHQQSDAAVAPPEPPDASPLEPTEAGPFRRSLMTRSPLGNLAHADNLLIDGDMEMSSGMGQTPWIGLSTMSQTELKIETGGRCRSGLRCLVLTASANTVLGRGVAARDKALEFWLWAKVPGNKCDIVSVYLVPGMTLGINMFNKVRSETHAPDESGWCRFHTLRAPMDESVAVYVEASPTFQQRVLIDDAVLRPADGVSPTKVRMLPVDPAEHARIVAKIGPILRQQWLGRPEDRPRVMERTGRASD